MSEEERKIVELAKQTWPALAAGKATKSVLTERSRYLCKVLRNQGQTSSVSDISKVLCREFGSGE